MVQVKRMGSEMVQVKRMGGGGEMRGGEDGEGDGPSEEDGKEMRGGEGGESIGRNVV